MSEPRVEAYRPEDGAVAPRPPARAVRVLVQRLDPEAELPSDQLEGDAGADLVTTVDVHLAPGERAVLPTGIAIALPDGYAAFIHPRSGLAARIGLSMVNAPGTIDAGYRGEIKVIAINLDPVHPIRLHRGERIAQLVFQRVERATFFEVDRLPDSQRGAGGHGSTGGAQALRPTLAQGGPTSTNLATETQAATDTRVSHAGEEGTA